MQLPVPSCVPCLLLLPCFPPLVIELSRPCSSASSLKVETARFIRRLAILISAVKSPRDIACKLFFLVNISKNSFPLIKMKKKDVILVQCSNEAERWCCWCSSKWVLLMNALICHSINAAWTVYCKIPLNWFPSWLAHFSGNSSSYYSGLYNRGTTGVTYCQCRFIAVFHRVCWPLSYSPH